MMSRIPVWPTVTDWTSFAAIRGCARSDHHRRAASTMRCSRRTGPLPRPRPPLLLHVGVADRSGSSDSGHVPYHKEPSRCTVRESAAHSVDARRGPHDCWPGRGENSGEVTGSDATAVAESVIAPPPRPCPLTLSSGRSTLRGTIGMHCRPVSPGPGSPSWPGQVSIAFLVACPG